MRVRTRTTAAVVVAAAVALLGAACGDNSPTATGSGGEAERPKPTRIVSLSATATEMLFAIGAGEQVIAVDDQSNFPPEAPRTDLSSYKPNVEAVAAKRPDLVVISDDGPELKQRLEAVKISVVALPAAKTLEDTYRQIGQLGELTRHEEEADRVVDNMKDQIESIVESLPTTAKGSTYYHELDPSYFTATSKTFIGSVYALLGLENIADPADEQSGGYPQLSAEFIVQADPQFIFLADAKCCQQSAATVKARDGWTQISAVKGGRVIALDDDIASRWGPRIVDFLAEVATQVGNAKKAA